MMAINLLISIVAVLLLCRETQSYVDTLATLKSSLGVLLAKHEELSKGGKFEEASKLREELLSLHMELYKLKDGAQFTHPQEYRGNPRLNRDLRDPNEILKMHAGEMLSPASSSADGLRKNIQDNLREVAGGLPGGRNIPGLPPGHPAFPIGRMDPSQMARMQAQYRASMGQQMPPFPATNAGRENGGNQLEDQRSKLYNDAMVRMIRQRVDDMKSRVDNLITKAPNSNDIIAKAQELKFDIEKYYLAEVDMSNLVNDESSKLFGLPSGDAQRRFGRFPAPHEMFGEGTMFLDESSRSKREEVITLRQSLLKRIADLETESRTVAN